MRHSTRAPSAAERIYLRRSTMCRVTCSHGYRVYGSAACHSTSRPYCLPPRAFYTKAVATTVSTTSLGNQSVAGRRFAYKTVFQAGVVPSAAAAVPSVLVPTSPVYMGPFHTVVCPSGSVILVKHTCAEANVHRNTTTWNDSRSTHYQQFHNGPYYSPISSMTTAHQSQSRTQVN